MCDKSYTQSHSLNYHVKIHHEGMKAEKRYKCDLCEKAFTQSHSLKDHQKKAHIVKQYGLDTIARWDWKIIIMIIPHALSGIWGLCLMKCLKIGNILLT